MDDPYCNTTQGRVRWGRSGEREVECPTCKRRWALSFLHRLGKGDFGVGYFGKDRLPVHTPPPLEPTDFFSVG